MKGEALWLFKTRCERWLINEHLANDPRISDSTVRMSCFLLKRCMDLNWCFSLNIVTHPPPSSSSPSYIYLNIFAPPTPPSSSIPTWTGDGSLMIWAITAKLWVGCKVMMRQAEMGAAGSPHWPDTVQECLPFTFWWRQMPIGWPNISHLFLCITPMHCIHHHTLKLLPFACSHAFLRETDYKTEVLETDNPLKIWWYIRHFAFFFYFSVLDY